jgi:archaellum component FlaG (FlaF/FlaG flagellin family)
MTQSEIVLFVSGLLIGAQIVAVVCMVLDMREADRNLARAEKDRKRAAGDTFLSSLKTYQLLQKLEARR